MGRVALRSCLVLFACAARARGLQAYAALGCLPLAWSAQLVVADDWPQWMGPQRDSVWRETGIIDKFPANGPDVRWKAAIHGGYSGPAVAGGRVFVTDYIRRAGDASNDPSNRNELQGTERILCFEMSTGTELWKHEYHCPYHISYPAGPRTTPTVDGDRVYTLGAEGHLVCCDVRTGEVIWTKELKRDYGVSAPLWGFCAHPLVDGDRLICVVGGEGSVAVAFDKKTGRELWRALSAKEPGYCPPSIIQAAGTRQLLIWHAEAICSLNPETGNVYWTVPLEPAYCMSIAQPRRFDDYLFASGIGNVSALLKIDSDQPGASVEWKGTNKNSVYSGNSTPVIDDGVVYGSDCQGGHLQAFDLKSGERLWQTYAPTTGTNRRASHGTAFLVKNGDRYVLFSETGELIFARLSREKYDEIDRCKILEPTGEAFGRSVVWSHPAYANRCVFARNDKELVCVSLAN